MTGPTFVAAGQEKTLVGVDVAVSVHEQRTVATGDGAVRDAPREPFPSRWDALHTLYFGGYGLWNYLTTPYLLTLPGVRTEELPGRRLRVVFPPRIATHSAEQVFYFDEAGLQRRVDYAPYVLGSRSAAHYTEAHKTVSGLVFPTHRHVLPIVDGRPGRRRVRTAVRR